MVDQSCFQIRFSAKERNSLFDRYYDIGSHQKSCGCVCVCVGGGGGVRPGPRPWKCISKAASSSSITVSHSQIK